ncbi:MAG: hypothetical protein A2821_01975 [Candidatus Magasanikbacteria bacterium RIFCSPHIGHO2_01_FULL_41_23]|uniref:HTH cro/C1-type domain-containing protein n=1 Tax=Candidatus Magasanikbacteria bacterium RIFCSPLOWO2_01_FULL_40_15 TaxID=1798686 RepID=A0A1F6N2Q2_9BACT|nr:MAG: hypothetical protein A2821_01975 [Candidatus Magasanikbacteria bacterium RIFCSPHIGHO2_01_FULL_41_23]OGH67086.1 MAG: hypothetical protein A3C66_00135 [Candidatus Magasanikbacteria bacterium RIFCSPHIGHO2_02_FULL_41_35]OGH75080.1 MAG: hypothetical protein A3F22_04865 [Candidatus Magasanikbacteria bacterium RIFCSPHIGHO2_12_FULL_41_16]OGH78187.1 MAG: hypothetical protein A2983_00025 [Candidatus Magasanikbacteria bacterium RIFCSPLOWO2_01_FULL_40_15]
MTKKLTDFEKDLKRELKDPDFKKKFDGFGKQFEVAYQMVELRKQKKMSQNDLAKKIGTTQSNIARMETGKQNFSMAILLKMASAFKKELKINFV